MGAPSKGGADVELPAQGLGSSRRSQASLPNRDRDRLKAGFADLEAAAASSSALCDFQRPELGTLTEDTRSSPCSLTETQTG